MDHRRIASDRRTRSTEPLSPVLKRDTDSGVVAYICSEPILAVKAYRSGLPDRTAVAGAPAVGLGRPAGQR